MNTCHVSTENPRGNAAIAVVLVAALFAGIALPRAAPAAEPAPAASADDLAKQLSNPVAALISVPIQQNFEFGYASGGWKSLTNVQPVVPVSISADWNMISRTILPIVFQEDVTAPGNSESGIGDVLQSLFFSPKAPTASGLIWGVGPAVSIPVGSNDLSLDTWLAGPTAVVLKQHGAWTIGGLVNHLWNAGGSRNVDVSSTFLQPFVSWGGLGKGQTVGVNFESSYDWNAEQLTLPLNVSYSRVSKLGDQLVSYSVGGKVYLDGPAGGPDWGLRVALTLLFPR